MIKNYFKVAWRNLLKNKAFSFINICGLAVSMAVCLFIINIMLDRGSYDSFHVNKDRICRVLTYGKNGDDTKTATAPFPLAAALQTGFTGIEKTTVLSRGVGGDVIYDERIASGGGYFADSNFFKVFDFKLLAGSPETALQNPYAIVLSADMATLLFGKEDPVGKIISLHDKHMNPAGTEVGNREVDFGNFTVTGVMQAPPAKTNIPFSFLVSNSTMPSLAASGKISFQPGDWNDVWNNYVYVLLEKGRNKNDLQLALNKVAGEQYGKGNPLQFDFRQQGITEIAYSDPIGNESAFFFPKTMILVLSILGLIVMLSACLNYTNLSVARLLSRAKEVGLRKVTGASRSQVFIQFIAESVLVALLSLLLAVGFFMLLKSAWADLWINNFFHVSFRSNIVLYVTFVGFSILIGIVAGLLPSFYMSLFNPLQMMRNFSGVKLFRHVTLRRVLLTTQFCVSLIFIISTVLLQKQTNYLLNFDFGFDKNNIINVKLYKTENYQRFVNSVAQNKNILGISAAAFAPATGINNGTMVYKADNKNDSLQVNFIDIDANCVDVWGLRLVAGKNLPPLSSDSIDRYVLVNETMVRESRYAFPEAAVGKKILVDGHVAEITGVVKDFQFMDLTRKMAPLMLRNRASMFGIASIKLAPQHVQASVAFLEKKWKEVNPSTKFEYQFFDEQLQFTHSLLSDISKILGLLSFLAIFISSIGLLGMAIYTAETRTKEIGIRKVLGSPVMAVVMLLSKNYIVLLLISIFVATPLAFILNNIWLQFFPYRVQFGIGILAGSVLLVLFISLSIVLSQSYRAAVANPIKSLRTE